MKFTNEEKQRFANIVLKVENSLKNPEFRKYMKKAAREKVKPHLS